MEGLIPFVYRAIVEYKNGRQDLLGSWLNESPSAAYMRLPGDSGRLQASDIQALFRPDYGIASSATSSSSTTTTSQIKVSSGVHSPVGRRVAV